ncbi:hypothetical protein [Mycobacterium kansasii]|uniref:hypothetical protein n=1 Tax=Mycobacterium kansasii TaxID=1768 RepID=UPI003F609B22
MPWHARVWTSLPPRRLPWPGTPRGVLAVEALKAGGARDVELLALAQLIARPGRWSRAPARDLGARRSSTDGVGHQPPTPSASSDCSRTSHRTCARCLPPVLSIRNGRRSVVITGTPEQLSRFELYCRQISEKEEADRKNKVRGGDVFAPVFEPVRVEVGLSTRRGWATASTSSAAGPRRSASTSRWPGNWPNPSWVRKVDWVDEITRVHEAGARAGSLIWVQGTS